MEATQLHKLKDGDRFVIAGYETEGPFTKGRLDGMYVNVRDDSGGRDFFMATTPVFLQPAKAVETP